MYFGKGNKRKALAKVTALRVVVETNSIADPEIFTTAIPCSRNCPLFGDCVVEFEKQKPITQFDRIKAMGVDEMAEFLMDFVTEALTNPKCIVVKKWLESEVDNDAE